ncbi:MAG: RepB family plasmid replication initiator protein [Gammaproteobacteria bacterium]|nr:RepB family plasmid replication initiator protein [Gammaproteobacteria bacterium]
MDDKQIVVTASGYQLMIDANKYDAARDLKVVSKSLSKKSLAIKISDKRTRTINYTSAIDSYTDENEPLVVITFNALFWPYLINLTVQA